jgi:hypothetical protein
MSIYFWLSCLPFVFSFCTINLQHYSNISTNNFEHTVSKMKLLAFTSLSLTVLLAPTTTSQFINTFQGNSLPQSPALSSTPLRNDLVEGRKSSPEQRNFICTTSGSCLNDCGTSHSDCTKDLDPSYHFCNNIGDEWTCSQRPEGRTSSASSLLSSTIFPISVSARLELFPQRTPAHLYDGDLEDNQDEDDIQQHSELEPTLLTNITMQVKRGSCGANGGCDPDDYSNTCCGPQEDNCCLNVHGNCSAYKLCEYKWINPCNAWCLLPSGCSSLRPPRIFTIPSHILRSIVLTLSSSSLRLLGIFSLPQSLFQSALLTLSNAKSALAKQLKDKRDSIQDYNDTDCGPLHLVYPAGYNCQIVSKANYRCSGSGTSSLRLLRTFLILFRTF